MSIKVYNPNTARWEAVASTVATGIAVVDVEDRFTTDNVNDCLLETAANLETLSGRVEYIYEHGTIGGGGGGGGGGVLPTVTIDGDTTRNVKSDELLDIFYFFTSPNPGDGMSSISYGSVSLSTPVKQGRNKQTLGPFAKGQYTVTIMVQDSQGFWSVPIRVTVISGSLDLSSTFSDATDFTLVSDINIPYTISTLMSEDVFLDYTIDKVKYTAPARIGANMLVVGKLQHMGPTYLKMQARNSTYVSNILNYALVAADSDNLYLIPVTYPDDSDGTVNNMAVGTNLVLDYRVSMKNQFSFNSVYYIDEVRFANVVSKPGVNYWNIGIVGAGNINVGPHKFRIVTSTTDGLHSDIIEFAFNVTATDYVPYAHVTQNLIAQFDAAGKLNTSINRDVWADTSGNHVACTLHNFNYSTNGWKNNALDVSGKSYAVIALAPFLNGIKLGFTFEIVFKTQCAGNIDAKVVSCRNPVTPFQGFEIDTSQAILTSATDTVAAQIQENAWTKVSYVVNRGDPSSGTTNTMLVYVNGIISNVDFLAPNNPTVDDYSDGFSYPGYIYIGAGLDANANVINNSLSSIKSIRIYDRALSDIEIVTNYIADITDPDQQVIERNLNAMDVHGVFDENKQPLPRLDIRCDIEGMDEDAERLVNQITYNDPTDPSKNFTADFGEAYLSWQGTSSRVYPVKNWTIRLLKAGNPYLYTPKDSWLPDLRWTLKANYMDSSNANNVGLCKFIHDFLKTNTVAYPNEIVDPRTRAQIDGFPIYLTMNGAFMGVYTWNIDRYGYQNYGFVTYAQQGANVVETRNRLVYSYEILANTSEGAGAFKLPLPASDPNSYAANWNAVKGEFRCRYTYDTKPTTIELVGGVPTEVLAQGKHEQLLHLIEWVNDATDQEFVNDVSAHWSLPHLIDYYLIAYMFGMVDNLGKNMVLTTYGPNDQGNDVWFPAFYDCDSTLGLNNSGFVEFDAGLDTATGDYNTSDSNLWVKLNRNFSKQISDRYQQMRLSRITSSGTLPPWFSFDTSISYLAGQVMDKIGASIYNLDARAKYINISDRSWFHACNGSRENFTDRWLMERFIYLDSVYEFNYSDKVVIRSNVQGYITISIMTYSPEWVKISFTDAADAKIRKVCHKTGWTDFSYNVTNATDNNIEIYGADILMHIDGIKLLNPGSINIAQAPKLVELDVSGSDRIQILALGANTYLQQLNCYNCPNLGYQVSQRTLDVSGCTNLRELNLSNSHILNVRFNDVGGVLETLDASHTDITTFQLIGQDYLDSISLGGCRDLSTLSITACGGLESLLMPDTNLSTVTVTGCAKLSMLDISRTRNLRTFNISGCPNLRTLVMAGVSNTALTEADLSYAPLLETFDMSASGYIQFVTLPSFPAVHTNQKLDVVNSVAILDTKNVNQPSIVVRLSDVADPILTTDFTTALNPTTGFITITLIPSSRVPADQGIIYVTYTNNCCLTTFTCNSSAITSLKFGRNSTYPTRASDGLYALDLTGLPLKNINFAGCANLIEVRNINYTAAGSSAPFTSCINLKTLTGTIVLRDTVTAAFADCFNLSLDGLTLDLTNATNMFGIFQNCQKLSAANAYYALQHVSSKVTNYNRLFVGCTGITGNFFQTYPTMFNKSTGVTTASELFNNCTGITGPLPAALLSYMPNLTVLDYAFQNVPISGALPTGLFDSNTKLTTCVQTFRNTKLTNLTTPQALLFRYNSALTSVNSMFLSCTSLQLQVDDNLFVANPALVDVSNFFNGCTKVFGSVPPNVFNNIPLTGTSNNLTNAGYFFSGTAVNGSIPTGFLDNSRNLQIIEGLFNNCTGLTGAIPPDLCLFNTKLSKFGLLFAGCTGLTGTIPPNILRGKTAASATNRMFFNCSNIDSDLPTDFLLDCPNLTDISETFSGCLKLHGTIQARDSFWLSTEQFKLIPIAFLAVESPDLTGLTVRLDAVSNPLARDIDYKVAINAGVTSITMVSLTPTTLLVHLPHSISMTQGVATLPSNGVNQATLIVSDSLGNVFLMNTDYTLSTSGSNILITRTLTGAIPVDMSTIYVAYDRTVPVDNVAVLDTYNIDLSSLQVRPVIASDTGDIKTQNLTITGTATPTSTIDVTGLSGAATCCVRVRGAYTGALTAQTTLDGITWSNLPNNQLLNLSTNVVTTTIASGLNGAFSFACSGKQGVRISANGGFTGTATVTMYVNSVTATNGSDYTAAKNTTTGYTEVTRNRNSVVIPSTQTLLVVTYRHYDLSIDDRQDLINRSTRPELLGQAETVNSYGFLDKQVNLTKVNGLFNSCKHAQFNGTVPPRLFMSGSKITDMNNMFAFCWYLTGWLPPALLHNCPSVQNLSGMFVDCVFLKDPTNTYAIPPHFFDNCPNVTTLRQFLDNPAPDPAKPHGGLTSINGVLDKDLFKNLTRLTDISFLIRSSAITGILDSDLFKYNTAITACTTAFWSCSGLTGLGPNLFRTCTAMQDMTNCFAGCVNLTGPAPAYWASDSTLKAVTAKSACFRSDTKLSNYSSIPAGWL